MSDEDERCPLYKAGNRNAKDSNHALLLRYSVNHRQYVSRCGLISSSFISRGLRDRRVTYPAVMSSKTRPVRPRLRSVTQPIWHSRSGPKTRAYAVHFCKKICDEKTITLTSMSIIDNHWHCTVSTPESLVASHLFSHDVGGLSYSPLRDKMCSTGLELTYMYSS